MLSSIVYNRYSDNIAPSATITVQTGTAATDYPVTWVADFDASRPSKLNETTGAWLFNFGSAKTIKLAAIFHANFQAGLEIRIQANATNVWTAPSLNVAVATPAWNAGRMPTQPWVDLRAVAGAGAYQYWRVAVLSANSVPLSVGDIWLGDAYRILNAQWGNSLATARPQIEHQTSYRKFRFSLGNSIRRWKGTFFLTDAERDEVTSWITNASGRPVLFIPQHTGEAWLALHGEIFIEAIQALSDMNYISLTMEEDGRGLEPTPSPL